MTIKKYIKVLFEKDNRIIIFILKLGLKIYNYLNYNNRIITINNKFIFNIAQLGGVKLKILGKNNKIIIGNYTRLLNCNIIIYGNDNLIKIDGNCYLKDVEFWIEDDKNKILVGEHTTIHGKTQLATMEATKISIGKDCMFSNDIYFRTGDSHSVIDLQGKRINSSKDIIIGNHVWIGQRNIVLKNTEVVDNCIIGANSVLCKKYLEANSVIAGSPAKIIKNNVNWLRERI